MNTQLLRHLLRHWGWGFLALNLTSCIVVIAPSPTPTFTPPPALVTATVAVPPTPADTLTPIQAITATTTATPAPQPSLTVAPSPSALPATPPNSLTASPAPIAIFTFTIAPTEIRPGGEVTLTWEAQAEQVVIYRLDPQGRLTLPAYDVPLSGTLTLTTSELLRNQISFVLFAIRGGSSAQAGTTARITCPDVWFFANPPSSCPGSPPHETFIQAQRFERGVMLWTQWNDFIYILFADDLASPKWQAQLNGWFSGMPASDPNITPPAGYFQPIRGFGLAWRDEQMPEGSRVRDRVGWALAEEFSVGTGAFQCDSAPKYNTCFISGPDGVVYELKPERSGWGVWVGP